MTGIRERFAGDVKTMQCKLPGTYKEGTMEDS